MALSSELQQWAHTAGIDLLGITSTQAFIVGEEQKRVDPVDWLAGAKAIVVAACFVYPGPIKDPSSISGHPYGQVGAVTGVSRIARHYSENVISEYLMSIGHSAVNTNKLPFKQAAVRSGIVQYGKNCLVYAEGFGSYLELGCVITDAPFDTVDAPMHQSDCGDCTICMNICPTGAIDRPFHVRREECLSLWLADGMPIPSRFREKVGNSILRCDLCRRHCPKNRKLIPRENAPFPIEQYDQVELIPLLLGDSIYYQHVFPGFERYTCLETLHRNVAITLGNIGDTAAIPALTHAAASSQPEIRDAALWALEKIRMGMLILKGRKLDAESTIP